MPTWQCIQHASQVTWHKACLHAGKMLQANRMSLLMSDDGGMAQTRVNVLPEMPLLDARLAAPSLQLVDTDQAQVGPVLM